MLKPLLFAFALAGGASAAGAQVLEPVVVERPYYGLGSPVESAVPGNLWSGAYAGGHVGIAWAELQTPPGNLDFEGSALGLHAGYLQDFGQFVGGAELAWTALRDLEVEGTGYARDGDVLDARLIGGYDLARFLPYAFVGLSRMTIDPGGPFDEQSGAGVSYGIGAKFKATEKLLLGVDWTQRDFGNFDDAERFDLEASTLGLGASFRF